MQPARVRKAVTLQAMKTAIFSAHAFEKEIFEQESKGRHSLLWIDAQLSEATAIMAQGCAAVCIFVNDDGSAAVLRKLYEGGTRFLVLRSAGYNHVDLKTAQELNMRVAYVPEYSPYAVAEHAVALMMALNRKLVRAHSRIRECNFSLNGLTGFDMHGKTVGIIGFGKIGKVLANILLGFGCRVLAFDPKPDPQWQESGKVDFTDVDTICRDADIISLHAPLTPDTKYLIAKERIAWMKRGVMLINTSRGGLVHTRDVIDALKSGQIGYLGLDVYEEERGLFFEDHSDELLQDDVIARLTTFPNVLITAHQAFLTDTALHNIAETTIGNLDDFAAGRTCAQEIF